jgi:multiple antibiotic resistance protein
MNKFSAILTLFLIMDPLGNVPMFISALRECKPQRRRVVIARELLIAYGVLAAFLFLGKYLLQFLQLKSETISIAGGIVLFLIALRMVFPHTGGLMGDTPEGEPFIVPLAIPLVAGPSTLAALLLLQQSDPSRMFDWWTALTVAWVLTSIILLSSTLLFRLLRERGLIAMERLMGMLLVMVSVQMFLDGVAKYLAR